MSGKLGHEHCTGIANWLSLCLALFSFEIFDLDSATITHHMCTLLWDHFEDTRWPQYNRSQSVFSDYNSIGVSAENSSAGLAREVTKKRKIQHVRIIRSIRSTFGHIRSSLS